MAGRLVVIEHEDHATLDLMAASLAASGAFTVDVVRPYRGDAVPENTGGISGLVVLGGEMGALDDEAAPWLPATRRLMAQAVDDATPLLGICLGAQLLAAATGGRVERGGAGLELGLTALRVLPAAAADAYAGHVLAGLGGELGDVLHYHRDAVVTLPPDAELLVTGDRYPHQVFRVGRRAWGVQYHPEVSGPAFDRWLLSADLEAPEDAVRARAEIADRPAQYGRQRLADAHATALLAAAAVVA